MNSQNMISRAIFCDPVSLVKKEKKNIYLIWSGRKEGLGGERGGVIGRIFRMGPFL